MRPYNQRLSITKGGYALLLVLILLASLQDAYGQNRTSPLHAASGQGQTNPLHETAHVAQQAHDVDSDDGLLRIEGSLRPRPNYLTLSLALRVSSAGDDPVLRKRPGRTKYSNVTLEKDTADAPQTKAQDYNSSRSNNSNSQSSDTEDADTGETSSQTVQANYNTTRSNHRRSHVSDGALEHTDDWIAARATAPGSLYVALVPVEDKSSVRDVHSGKLTGVRQHGPIKTAKPVDAATPYIYKASVDTDGAFVFEGVAPGAYQVCVVENDTITFRGHVTVLK